MMDVLMSENVAVVVVWLFGCLFVCLFVETSGTL